MERFSESLRWLNNYLASLPPEVSMISGYAALRCSGRSCDVGPVRRDSTAGHDGCRYDRRLNSISRTLRSLGLPVCLGLSLCLYLPSSLFYSALPKRPGLAFLYAHSVLSLHVWANPSIGT